MKSIVSCFVFLLASAGALTAQSSAPLIADIPFPFFVGNQQMPAGEYRLVPEDKVLMVESERPTREQALILIFPALAKVEGKRSFVVFNEYGEGRIFLKQIVRSEVAIASQTVKSTKERESVASTLHTSSYPTKVVILARAR
jgi:hypothetical protein